MAIDAVALLRALPALVLCAVVAGCLPADRLNSDCRFTEPPRPLDLSRAADRRHLREDGRIAEELGIRQGDATRGRESIPQRTLRAEGCTGALFDQIGRLHGVSAAAVAAAAQQREAWVDLVFVFLPAAVIYWLMCTLVADRVNARFLPDEPDMHRWMVLLAALFVSGLGLFVGEMWAWLVEMTRNHDLHISYRAFRLPWVRHRLLIYLIGVVMFGAVSWWRDRRTRSSGIRVQGRA